MIEEPPDLEHGPFGCQAIVEEIIGKAFDADAVRRLFFRLQYRQHGGSGLGMSLADIERADVSDLLWYDRELQDQREEERRAMERAYARKT